MRQSFCVHADTPYNDQAIACGKPIFRRTHGWLCVPHYRAQQDAIPVKPRKPQPRFIDKTRITWSDEAVIANIIATDKQAIATGTVRKVRFGIDNPLVLRYLDGPTIH